MNKRKKTPFGQYLVEQIKAAGMSQEAFYTKVGITKPYFYDLLNSAPPPAEMQRKMISVLNQQTGPDVKRERKLFDLAAQERDEVPADLDLLIKAKAGDWDTIRNVLSTVL